MSKFGAVKSKITNAINGLNRAVDKIDASLLQPFSSSSSLRAQCRQLSKRNGDMNCAKLNIETALEVLDRRYRIAQRYIDDQENGDTLALGLDRHWEKHKGLDAQQNANAILSQLDSQIELVLALANQIRGKLAAAVVADNLPLDRTSSQESLLSENNTFPRNPAAATSPTQVAFAQLRKLEVPTFDGDQGQFYDWWARFKTMVHNNSTISAADKLLHLISSLKGTAALVVESLDITDPDSYEPAIKTLLQRYDRRDFTHHHFLQKLEDLPPSTATASLQMETLCRIQACIRQLDRFEDTSQSLSLKILIRKKFPKDTQLEVVKMEHRSGTSWSLHQLLEGFDKYIEELEKIDDKTLRPNADNTAIHSLSADEDAEDRPTTPLQGYDPDVCCFCSSPNHPSSSCYVNMAPSNRRLIVDRHRLCYKCLILGHVASACSTANCNRCGKSHHPFLCLRNPLRRSINRRSPSNDRQPRDSHRSPRSRHMSRNSSREAHSRRSSSRDYSRSPVRLRSRDREARHSTRYSSSYSRYPSRRSPSPYAYSSRFIPPSLRHSPRSSFRTYRRSSPYPSRSPPSVRFADSSSHPSNRRRQDSPSPARNRSSIHAVSTDSEYEAAAQCFRSVQEASALTPLLPPAHQAMLMIVRAYAYNRRTGSWDPVSILLDSGAQTSFITIAAVSRLSLIPRETRPLTTVTFGGHRQTEDTDIVEVELFDPLNQLFVVLLNAKDVVSAARQAQQFSPEDLAALQQRRIDPDTLLVTQRVEPDILLGMDYFWRVKIDDPPEVLPSGLVLSHTRFGPTVSGLQFFRDYGSGH